MHDDVFIGKHHVLAENWTTPQPAYKRLPRGKPVDARMPGGLRGPVEAEHPALWESRRRKAAPRTGLPSHSPRRASMGSSAAARMAG